MNKRHFTLLFFVLLYSSLSFAQKEHAVYFKSDRVTRDSSNADYYRVIDSKAGESFSYSEYHKDGTWIKATGKGDLEHPVKNGDERYFYKTGKLAVINHYDNGNLITTIGYYPNGVLLQVLEMRPGWPGVLVAYDADSSGRVHITKGNGKRQETDSIRSIYIKGHYTMEGPYKDGLKDGLWNGADDRGCIFEEKYEAGRLMKGTTKTTTDKKYRYNSLYNYPKFKGSIDQFEAHIIPALKNAADTAGLKFIKPGYLQLGYTIDEGGRIIALHGFKKEGQAPVNLDLKMDLPKIEPAKIRGVPISYTVFNNAYRFIRDGFKPVLFQTNLYLKGTYTRYSNLKF